MVLINIHSTCFKNKLIIYTASLSKYADPLLDILDPDRVSKHCTNDILK